MANETKKISNSNNKASEEANHKEIGLVVL